MSFETIWSFVTSNAMELIALGVSSGVAIYTTLSSKGLEKQKSKLQKQIDRANSLNERVTHIQNNQFDYKFEICKNLSETSFRMCHYFCIYLQCVIMKNPFDYVTEQEYMSKVEPKIPDGSIVLVKATQELQSKDVGIFIVDGEAMCKRYIDTGEKIILVPDNRNFERKDISDENVLLIQGKVVDIDLV